MKKLSALRRGGVPAARRLPGLLLLAALTLFTAAPLSTADEARFFRISSPAATTITTISPDGYVTWTNAVTNATCTVQTALSLIGPSNWVDYVQVPVSTAVTVHRIFDPNPPAGMVLIPAGSFTMGNCMATNEGYADELPLHTVYVSAFYMDKDEVTKALWDEVCNWSTNRGYDIANPQRPGSKAADQPVYNATWYQMVKWCNARSEKEGWVPAYYTNAAQTGVYRTGDLNVQNGWVKWNAGCRLPTEAEWEKAARGGVSGHRFPWSGTDDITHGAANYYSYGNDAYDTSSTRYYHPFFCTNTLAPYTSPVGYFAPNGYGLYDMAGNISEWCWDWYGVTYYSSSPVTDPRGPATGGYRVWRGSSWGESASLARCASRDYLAPSGGFHNYGFRCVRGR